MDTKKYSNEKGLEFREPIDTIGGGFTYPADHRPDRD